MIMEDVIERMRTRDVKINVSRIAAGVKDAISFSISYDRPSRAWRCRWPSAWPRCSCEENLEDRELLADATNQFLQAQLEDARRRLVEHEKSSRSSARATPAACRRRCRPTSR